MLFSTPQFGIFFLVYLVLHVTLPYSWRLPLIIAGSTFFYGWWKPAYVWLPFALTLVAFIGVHWIEQTDDANSRRRRLITVIATLFGPLLFFKYLDFLYASFLGSITGDSGKLMNLTLPLGISFVTFTLTAYIVDVWRRIYPAEKNFFRLLGYVLFFPHLIAGPSLRPHELLPQLANWRDDLRTERIFAFSLISIGLFKKLVFADSIARVVDQVYAPGAVAAGWDYLFAIYGFSVQIYCDFSGYSDMAVGLALLLGIRLPANFHAPYAATSVVDFWRRWHMTLSTWLRDYLYIPLGGNRVPLPQQMLNIIITMLLGGLWHGANWTFVIWGGAHGLALAFVHLVRRFSDIAIPAAVSWILTFHFVTLAWIFFRAPDFATALKVFSGPFTGSFDPALFSIQRYAFALLIIVVFLLTHRFDTYPQVRAALSRMPRWLLFPIWMLLWILAITVSQGSSAKFIFFDF
jgi:alginate O-acetyltransferase complex protein AlgI